MIVTAAAVLYVYVEYTLADSVEEGEKIVNAAVDKFGRIGKTLLISLLFLVAVILLCLS